MKILNKLELMSPSIKVGGSNGYVVDLPENAGALLTEESTNGLILTAKTEAISESKSYTDQKVSSVYRVKGSVPSIEDLPEDAEIGDVYNISDDLGGHNYVKTEDGWDKLGGTVDLSPYALKTDVSGCVETENVETENLNVSGCVVVSGDSTFSGCTTFSQVPTVNGENLATVSYVSGCLNSLEYLSAHECIDCVLIVSDKPITFRQNVVFEGDSSVCINGSPIATKDYVDEYVDDSFCEAKEYIDCSLCTSLRNYLPATQCQCGNFDHYVVTETLFYGESEVATINDILPVTKGDQTTPIYSNSNACLEVYGIIAHGGMTVCGKPVATVSYVDQAKADANMYTDDCVAALNIGDYAKKTEVSGCLTALEGCVDAVEAKIPTDYFPATKINNNSYDASSTSLTLFSLTVVCGVTLPVHTSVDGECVATKPYVDQAESDVFCAAQAYTDEKIASLGSVLEYKGNKIYEELPVEGNEVGDVYNITADYAEKGIKAGDNVVWNGSDWDVLSAPIDLSGYYDKEEVDAALEGYLPVVKSEDPIVKYSVNEPVFFNACGNKFVSDVYFESCVYLNDRETNSLSYAVTESYVNRALEGYLPATATAEVDCTTKYAVDGRLFIGKEGESKVTSISYQHFCTYDIQSCTVYLVSEPTLDRHATPKSYVDNLVSTSISTANSNIVYDEDFVLGDGTFDASTSQMKWTVSPEGATKILSVIALDGEGNLVHPSYKWANNTLTVSIFAEAEQDDPGYTVTVSYKK